MGFESLYFEVANGISFLPKHPVSTELGKVMNSGLYEEESICV